MAEAFGLKRCKLPQSKIQKPVSAAGGITPQHVTDLLTQTT
jgi:hypothetical protein